MFTGAGHVLDRSLQHMLQAAHANGGPCDTFRPFTFYICVNTLKQVPQAGGL